jgi:hypothetical protein
MVREQTKALEVFEGVCYTDSEGTSPFRGRFVYVYLRVAYLPPAGRRLRDMQGKFPAYNRNSPIAYLGGNVAAQVKRPLRDFKHKTGQEGLAFHENLAIANSSVGAAESMAMEEAASRRKTNPFSSFLYPVSERNQ